MKITKDAMVKIHYTVKTPDGNVVDSSEGKEPLNYIHGNNQLIPGLETMLEGKEPGLKFKAVVKPEEAYGIYNDKLVVEVPKSQFETGAPIEVGMQFQAQTEDGRYVLVRVTKITDDTVTVDGNHELAGKELSFDVEIVDVREATEEELAGLGGCGCGGGCGGCSGDCGEGGCGEGGCGCGGCGN